MFLTALQLMTEDDKATIGRLGPIANDVGPSKPCCPACSVILQHVNWALSEMGQTKLVVPHSHSVVFGCALPPFLPRKIRRSVIKVFEQQLKTIIINLRAVLSAEDSGSQSPSVASEQSAPWSDATIDAIMEAHAGVDIYSKPWKRCG